MKLLMKILNMLPHEANITLFLQPAAIHDDISLMHFVIPGLTKPAPYLIRGNPGFFWIPVAVYPTLDAGQELRGMLR